MERTHICGGCGSREDVGYLMDATIAALQAKVKELEEWKQIVIGADSRQDLIYQLSDQLTQCMAELEAANIRADKAVQDRADVLNVKSTDGLTSSEWIMRTATAERKVKDLQAELERVSLLSSHNERRFEEVDKKYKELRTLILALPKVEEEIEIRTLSAPQRYALQADNFFLIGFATQGEADTIAELYRERQRMQ